MNNLVFRKKAELHANCPWRNCLPKTHWSIFSCHRWLRFACVHSVDARPVNQNVPIEQAVGRKSTYHSLYNKRNKNTKPQTHSIAFAAECSQKTLNGRFCIRSMVKKERKRKREREKGLQWMLLAVSSHWKDIIYIFSTHFLIRS